MPNYPYKLSVVGLFLQHSVSHICGFKKSKLIQKQIIYSQVSIQVCLSESLERLYSYFVIQFPQIKAKYTSLHVLLLKQSISLLEVLAFINVLDAIHVQYNNPPI